MVTTQQVAALKYLIGKSKETQKLLPKQVMFFLINQSEKLSREICVVLREDVHGTCEEISAVGHEVDWFNSSNGSTHLNEVFTAMGIRLKFSVHYGNLEDTGHLNSLGQFPGAIDAHKVQYPVHAPMRYTIWLAKPFYSRTAKILTVTRKELDEIDVSKPGLYPSLENTHF